MLDPGCPCEACTTLRDTIAAAAASGTLPDTLNHDDGSPVMVTAGDVTMTAAEAHLRLALTSKHLGEGDRNAIRALVSTRAGEVDPVVAAKLATTLREELPRFEEAQRDLARRYGRAHLTETSETYRAARAEREGAHLANNAGTILMSHVRDAQPLSLSERIEGLSERVSAYETTHPTERAEIARLAALARPTAPAAPTTPGDTTEATPRTPATPLSPADQAEVDRLVSEHQRIDTRAGTQPSSQPSSPPKPRPSDDEDEDDEAAIKRLVKTHLSHQEATT